MRSKGQGRVGNGILLLVVLAFCHVIYNTQNIAINCCTLPHTPYVILHCHITLQYIYKYCQTFQFIAIHWNVHCHILPHIKCITLPYIASVSCLPPPRLLPDAGASASASAGASASASASACTSASTVLVL